MMKNLIQYLGYKNVPKEPDFNLFKTEIFKYAL